MSLLQQDCPKVLGALLPPLAIPGSFQSAIYSLLDDGIYSTVVRKVSLVLSTFITPNDSTNYKSNDFLTVVSYSEL